MKSKATPKPKHKSLEEIIKENNCSGAEKLLNGNFKYLSGLLDFAINYKNWVNTEESKKKLINDYNKYLLSKIKLKNNAREII